MPSNETILLSEHGGTGRLLPNKPRSPNALDSQMLETIEDSVSRWETSADVVVLLVGSAMSAHSAQAPTSRYFRRWTKGECRIGRCWATASWTGCRNRR